MTYTEDQVKRETLKYFNGDELATNVWMSKYALKDREGNFYELTPSDMHHRLAKEFSRIENNYTNPISEDKIFELLDRFKFIVPGGSPMEGIGNNFKIQSLSNCYVIGNEEDSYGSILKIDEEQVHIMRRRGGVGSDLSHLRPKGAFTTCAAHTSTGVVPFAERYSNSTRETAQDGRRGARMLSLDITHPDAEEFIDSKLELKKITGSNISIRITDEFIQAVKEDRDFIQSFPIDVKIYDFNDCDIQSYYHDIEYLSEYNSLERFWDEKNNRTIYFKKIKAKKLWNKIIYNAWKSAEPGILFIDHIRRESPSDCYGTDWKTVSSNPCITGDTLIAVADGRNAVSIKQLTEEGKDIPVYSTNPENGSIKIKWGRNPRVTKNNAEVWKLTLDDGTFLLATPDHKIMLKDKSYCELSKLKKDQSLSPFNTYLSEGSWNDGYRCINSKSNGHARQYRMIYEFFNGEYDGKISNLHHKDENRLNDFPDNIELVNAKIHRSEHKLGDKNPYHTHDNVRLNLLEKGRHPGKENGRYIDISNEEIIEHGKKCLEQYGELTRNNWNKYVSNCEVKIPCVHNKFRFNRFSNFKSCVINNHKVKSVEFYGYEDVYNLTVDDFHNYNVITSGDYKYIRSSGITVKNCGEIPMNAYSSCILLCLNLYSYVNDKFTENSHFNFELFKYHVGIAQRLVDDIVDLEIEQIDKILNKVESDPESEDTKIREINLWNKIKQKIVEGRRTGLGITAEGDMLAALNLRYGSEEAIEFLEEVHRVLAVESYKSSINLAKERGCFPIWDYEKEKENPFIKRIALHLGHDGLSDYRKYGRRNIANLTIAPTGSVSILTQTTSGIEPAFQIYYKRRRKVNDKSKATFIDELGDMWEEYKVFHHKFVEWFKINHWNKVENTLGIKSPKEWLEKCHESVLQKYVEESPYYKATSSDVDYIGKVEMQGKIQKWIDHSISVTVNMPEKVSEETVSQVYMKAYSVGCKGITVYREGSRNGVLISDKKEEKQSIEGIIYNDAPKRPRTLKCDIYTMSRSKQSFTIIVGLLGDRPYEIFGLEKLDNLEFCEKIQEGELKKVKSKTYQLIGDYRGQRYIVDNIVEHMSDDEQKDTRKYSIQLRHGIHPKYIVEQINEFATITSFDKVIAKVLSNYLGDKKIKGEEVCPNCGGQLKYESGCVQCLNPECGWSKCS